MKSILIGWFLSYREARMPTRFESRTVEVSVFEGYVSFDRLRLGPCESVG